MIYLVFHITLNDISQIFRNTKDVTCYLCLKIMTGLQYCCFYFCNLDIGLFCQFNNILQLQLYINHLFNSLYNFIILFCPIFLFIVYCLNQIYVVKSASFMQVRRVGSSGKFLSHIKDLCQLNILELSIQDFTPLFIDFNLKFLTNNLQLPLLHEKTLFLLSIDHIHPYTLLNALKTVFHILISYTFQFLQLCIKHIMNHPSFWKLQFKCSMSNVL